MKASGLISRSVVFVLFTGTFLFINHVSAADPQVVAGPVNTVGLKSDGTVVATGGDSDGQCDVDEWTDITQVVASDEHTVGLKSDGTVVAVGRNNEDQCDVDEWTDITQVAASDEHTVGLKSDGTVVVAGCGQPWDYDGHCDVDEWTDITQVVASYLYTVGLKSDGTVTAVGWNEYGQCDVEDWTGIIQVAAGVGHTVGLKSDGTVKAVGNNEVGQTNISSWSLFTFCEGETGKVTLTSPVDTVETSKPSFVWEEISCAAYYYLLVETTDDEIVVGEWLLGEDVCSGGICRASGDAPMGFNNGDYTWAVETWNENGYGPWSDEMAFTVTVETDEH